MNLEAQLNELLDKAGLETVCVDEDSVKLQEYSLDGAIECRSYGRYIQGDVCESCICDAPSDMIPEVSAIWYGAVDQNDHKQCILVVIRYTSPGVNYLE